MGTVIEVNGVSKELARNQAGSFLNQNFRETLIRFYSRLARSEIRQTENFFALKDISFSLEAGESLMLIGKNGAGKSTLLRILARVTRPSQGKAIIRGRVAAILGVGAGFHPELTGRENIYLYGVLLGMKSREISAIFDQIVSFAEIGTFLDSPVKHYSSGMMMRLGFAVAVHVPADVMLLDEVLAVGDAAFQKKCIQRIMEIKNQGVSTIMVTHNISGAKAICDRALLLHDGEVCMVGEIDAVIKKYSSILLSPGVTALASPPIGLV